MFLLLKYLYLYYFLYIGVSYFCEVKSKIMIKYKNFIISVLLSCIGFISGWYCRGNYPSEPKLAYSLYVPDSVRGKQADLMFRMNKVFTGIDLATIYNISRMVYGVECPGLQVENRVIPIYEFDNNLDSLYEMVCKKIK